jgi:hypothetical protein
MWLVCYRKDNPAFIKEGEQRKQFHSLIVKATYYNTLFMFNTRYLPLGDMEQMVEVDRGLWDAEPGIVHENNFV